MSTHFFSNGIKTLLVIIFAFIGTLTILEFSLRLYGYDSVMQLKKGKGSIIQPSPYPNLRYELTPNASCKIYESDVTINSSGYRGQEGTPGKYNGYRILILGDSITFGYALPVEATFSSQLQQLLLREKPDFEILNFGVGGYDILQEVALLEHRGLKFMPDMVVVGYCLNDAGIASNNLKRITKIQSRQSNILFRSRLFQFANDRIDRYRTINWMAQQNIPEVFSRTYKDRIDKIELNEKELHALIEQVPDIHPSFWYKDLDHIGRTRYAFRHLGELSKRNNFSVLVVVIPWLTGELKTYPNKIAHQIVNMEAKRAGFDTIDMTTDFMRTGMKNLKLKDKDMVHPNKKGHALIAHAISKYVLKNLKQK
jgi:lysophospholipase L1-like esterase